MLLDRFVDSSLAYQGGGRGLGIEAVAELNRFGTGGLTPDRTLYLRLDPRVGRERQGVRGEEADRLEREGEDFFAAIALSYEDLAALEPERIRAIDAVTGARGRARRRDRRAGGPAGVGGAAARAAGPGRRRGRGVGASRCRRSRAATLRPSVARAWRMLPTLAQIRHACDDPPRAPARARRAPATAPRRDR